MNWRLLKHVMMVFWHISSVASASSKTASEGLYLLDNDVGGQPVPFETPKNGCQDWFSKTKETLPLFRTRETSFSTNWCNFPENLICCQKLYALFKNDFSYHHYKGIQLPHTAGLSGSSIQCSHVVMKGRQTWGRRILLDKLKYLY